VWPLTDDGKQVAVPAGGHEVPKDHAQV
jgi:hypothetical protein